MCLRAGVGGAMMGLANLVPGVSGGTMLVAVDIYPEFIRAVAETSTLRFRARTLLLLGLVAGAAGAAIVALAGPMRTLVVEHRWIMYSLFIGLTLGGVPVLARLLRPTSTAGGVRAGLAAATGVGLMALMLFVQPAPTSAGNPQHFLLFAAGIAGAAAMVLPGVSGAYLLLVLGQYETILGAIGDLRRGLFGADGSGIDWAVLAASMRVILPVGLGVVAGIVAVSNLVKWLLLRFETATLGFLLGLLVGAVLGLWPFQRTDDLGRHFFTPTIVQAIAAVVLIAVGFLLTLGIARLGRGHTST